MKIVVLASGSKGNATYIETKKARILIDSGIHIKHITEKLLEEGITLQELDAIFVSHEHADHVNYLAQNAKATNATIYMGKQSYIKINDKTKKTLNSLSDFNVEFIKSNVIYKIKDCSIVPIELSHDSQCAFGFLFKEDHETKNITFASITDTGIIYEKYFEILKSINTILIESNHDVDMLVTSNRPYFLIDRILSSKGHLSNETCMMYLNKIITKNTKRVILGHVSEDCNSDEMLKAAIIKNFGKKKTPEFQIARQYEHLKIFEVE